MPANTDRRQARTQAEWDELAMGTIVPALQAGTRMTEIRALYGAGPTIRAALARVGYDTKGQPVEALEVKASGKQLADRVAKLRLGGHNGRLMAWWQIAQVTGKDEATLKALLCKHGHEAVAIGRVTRAAATAAAVKPARKPRAKKAKAAVAAE